MVARKISMVRRNKTTPREESEILKMYCSEEELTLIKEWAHKGTVFIVLGSEYTDIRTFYKGLHQVMYSPVNNGASVYDCHYQYREANMRPYVTISLNDPVNHNHLIDNIKLLGRYHNKLLYKADYEKEAEEERSTKLTVAKIVLDRLGYSYTDSEIVVSKSFNARKIERFFKFFEKDREQFIENLLLNHFLSGSAMNASKLSFDGQGKMLGVTLSNLFQENEDEVITVKSKPFSFGVYRKSGFDDLDSAMKELLSRVQNNKEFLNQFAKSLLHEVGTEYKCGYLLLERMSELESVIVSTDLKIAAKEHSEMEDFDDE